MNAHDTTTTESLPQPLLDPGDLAQRSAEQRILGYLLLYGNMMPILGNQLTVAHFSGIAHRLIWLAMRELTWAKHEIDTISVIEQLNEGELMEYAAGVPYLACLAEGISREYDPANDIKLLCEICNGIYGAMAR